MIELITKLGDMPIPTILVITGIVFFFLAIGGQLGAKIITDRIKQRYAGILGAIFLISGLTLYLIPGILTPSTEPTPSPVKNSPRVLSTTPQNGDQEVAPSLKQISVIFNVPMMDGSWSWADGGEDKFPQTTAEPYYTKNDTRNVLPVKLEPNKEYIIWVNTADHKNFKDKNGNPATPYKFSFKTR